VEALSLEISSLETPKEPAALEGISCHP